MRMYNGKEEKNNKNFSTGTILYLDSFIVKFIFFLSYLTFYKKKIYNWRSAQ